MDPELHYQVAMDYMDPIEYYIRNYHGISLLSNPIMIPHGFDNKRPKPSIGYSDEAWNSKGIHAWMDGPFIKLKATKFLKKSVARSLMIWDPPVSATLSKQKKVSSNYLWQILTASILLPLPKQRQEKCCRALSLTDQGFV
jgi:hypothetical protein